MLNINGVNWRIVFVSWNNRNLYRPNGTLTVGMCDSFKKTIYISNHLKGLMLKKVICHEITHACSYSFGIKLNTQLEEQLADYIASYGELIVDLTDDVYEGLE